jgi:hypothetical protein
MGRGSVGEGAINVGRAKRSNVGWGDEGTPTTEPNHDEMLGFEDSPQPTALNVRQTAISPIYDYYEFDYFVRDENHGKYMTQATLVTMDSVLELIDKEGKSKDHRMDNANRNPNIKVWLC